MGPTSLHPPGLDGRGRNTRGADMFDEQEDRARLTILVAAKRGAGLQAQFRRVP